MKERKLVRAYGWSGFDELRAAIYVIGVCGLKAVVEAAVDSIRLYVEER